jgi:ABC-type sulfate transport system permease component
MFLAFGFAGLVGPQLAVRLSNGGDYTKAFMAAAVIALISFCLSLAVRKMTASK